KSQYSLVGRGDYTHLSTYQPVNSFPTQRVNPPSLKLRRAMRASEPTNQRTYLRTNLPLMQLDAPVSVQWIADFIGAKLVGDTGQMATGINEIHKVQPGDISFVDFEKYYDKCLNSPATVIIINKEVAAPAGKTLLVCPDPFSAYVSLVKHFRPF